MKKRIHRRKIVRRAKKNDQLWGVIWFVVLFSLALATFLVSRQSYLLGQTLGTCTTPYDPCPTNTSTPIPQSGGGGTTTTTTTTTTVAPSVATTTTTTVAPSNSTNQPVTTTTQIIPAPSNGESSLIASPEPSETPAIQAPRDFRSLISDPETGSVTPQSLIAAPAALTSALYDVAYDNIAAQINAFTNSVSHIESPTINRFRLPAQVCTFLGNVGMEWLCE